MTHSLVAFDDRFNIVRFEVAATHDHGLLDASKNVELAAVEIASITCVVPAVPNRRLRQLRIAKVPLHERRTPDISTVRRARTVGRDAQNRSTLSVKCGRLQLWHDATSSGRRLQALRCRIYGRTWHRRRSARH